MWSALQICDRDAGTGRLDERLQPPEDFDLVADAIDEPGPAIAPTAAPPPVRARA